MNIFSPFVRKIIGLNLNVATRAILNLFHISCQEYYIYIYWHSFNIIGWKDKEVIDIFLVKVYLLDPALIFSSVSSDLLISLL